MARQSHFNSPYLRVPSASVSGLGWLGSNEPAMGDVRKASPGRGGERSLDERMVEEPDSGSDGSSDVALVMSFLVDAF